MTRLSVALPESSEWIVEAIETVRDCQAHTGPRPSQGQVVREILERELEYFKPQEEQHASL